MTFDLANIILLLLSVFLSFLISNNAEKVKTHKINIMKIRNIYEVLYLDIEHNILKIAVIRSLVNEYIDMPTKYFGRNLKVKNRKKDQNYLLRGIIYEGKSCMYI